MNIPNEKKVSQAVRRLNPNFFAFGGLDAKKPESKTGKTLECQPQGRKAGKNGLGTSCLVARVSLVSYRRKQLDSDNLAGGFKPLRDAIARSFGLDDSDSIIEWEYGQCITSGRQGTAVKIEKL